MKTFDRSKQCRLFWAAAILGLLAACGEDEGGSPTDTGTSLPISVQEIVVSPKAGNPGDTLRLSAIVVSDTANAGDIPSMKWTATGGGAFLEDDGLSVRWIAPASGVYTATVTAKNTVNTATGSTDLFVGDSTFVVGSEAGTIRLQPNQTDLYYLRTEPFVTLSDVEVFSWIAGVAGDAVEFPGAVNGANGLYLTYAKDVSFEVHSADSFVVGATINPINLYVGDFASKTYRRISVDRATSTRHQGYLYPDVAPDSRLIAFEGYSPTPTSAGPDSFDIFVYDTAGPTRQKVTRTHTNHRNAFPTWSTDERWLTFVSDRGGNLRWELYGMPVSGGVINTDQASLVRLSDTGGTLADGFMRVSDFDKPMMAWNPAAPTLAVLATDGTTYLITTTTTGAGQVVVEPIPSGVPNVFQIPKEFAWSSDGTRLAVTTGVEVLTVSDDGSINSVIKRGSDTFADLAWSPDARWLAYRATRASSAWFEVIDFNQSPLPPPLPITAAEPAASDFFSLGVYRTLMSMSPAWSTSSGFFYATFATGSSTVGIISLDVSGLTP